MDIARGLTGLVKENYIMGFQLGLSLWEENLKEALVLMRNGIDRVFSSFDDYIGLIKG